MKTNVLKVVKIDKNIFAGIRRLIKASEALLNIDNDLSFSLISLAIEEVGKFEYIKEEGIKLEFFGHGKKQKTHKEKFEKGINCLKLKLAFMKKGVELTLPFSKSIILRNKINKVNGSIAIAVLKGTTGKYENVSDFESKQGTLTAVPSEQIRFSNFYTDYNFDTNKWIPTKNIYFTDECEPYSTYIQTSEIKTIIKKIKNYINA